MAVAHLHSTTRQNRINILKASTVRAMRNMKRKKNAHSVHLLKDRKRWSAKNRILVKCSFTAIRFIPLLAVNQQIRSIPVFP